MAIRTDSSKTKNQTCKSTMILTSMVFCLMLSCNYLVPKNEQRTTTHEGYYVVNRNSIIDSISQGNKDVFSHPMDTPTDTAPAIDQSVEWALSDYFLIAEAFHNFQWRESTDNWNLNHINTTMKCEDISVGPQYVFFWYFKTVNIQDEEVRLVHTVYIQPARNLIHWTEYKYYPVTVNWRSIEYSQLNITEQDALQIAEKNGGSEIRSSVNNNCSVGISLLPGSFFEGWAVSYQYGLDSLTVEVNTTTGEYKIWK